MTDPVEATTIGVVLVVDDEESMRHFVTRALRRAGYSVLVAEEAQAALRILQEDQIDVLVSDIAMPGMDGHELFREAAKLSPATATVLMTAHGTIADAVQALHDGAESYLAKPFEREALLTTVLKAREKAVLRRENGRLKARLQREGPLGMILGESPAMQRLKEGVILAGSAPGGVLVLGESGTGKGLVARAVHRLSDRAERPFITVHCGALAQGLVEAELFGVKAGAFTGATEDRPGYVERAEGGTLFLDEIAELPLTSQASLLRWLQERRFERVGDDATRESDVRVIAASQTDLRQLTQAGRFRADLFYRLDVHRLLAPPLRERPEDIPLLLLHFFAEAAREDLLLQPEALEHLQKCRWPGNVRELRNLAERLATSADGPAIGTADLPEETAGQKKVLPAEPSAPYRQALVRFEREYLENLLKKATGNVSEAARLGGMARPTLHARLKALEISAEDFRNPMR